MTDPASCCDLRVWDLWRGIVVWEVDLGRWSVCRLSSELM